MVALYSPSFTTSNGLGFAFEDDPASFLFEDLNSSYFTHDDHLPKKQYLASLFPTDLDPYSRWDVDEMIIPPSCNPSIFTDPLPCMGGGELSSPAISSGYSGKTVGSSEGAPVAGDRNKKQNHNASERMRRMKINGLYASLRALLPNSDHMKKFSIPNTVDRVVKYIPELQKEVQVLIQRKEKLLPATPKSPAASNNKACSAACSCAVQATQLGNGEISVQISTPKSFISTLVPISEVLRELEEVNGLVAIHVSSSESAAARVFHHFHLMALEASQKMIQCELLKEKVLSQCQKWEQLCLWMISQGLSST